MTEASSECRQLCCPISVSLLVKHSMREVWFSRVQAASSRNTGPVPSPKYALLKATEPEVDEYNRGREERGGREEREKWEGGERGWRRRERGGRGGRRKERGGRSGVSLIQRREGAMQLLPCSWCVSEQILEAKLCSVYTQYTVQPNIFVVICIAICGKKGSLWIQC